jgi:hypothetical protein
MSFASYLKHWLKINEAADNSQVDNFDEIKNLINSGIGGDASNKIARTTSFESIEQILQKLDILELEKLKNNTDLQEVLRSLSSPGKIEWFGEYLTKSKKNLSQLILDKKKVDPSVNFNGYTRFVVRENEVKSRIFKMHVIFKFLSDTPQLDKETGMLNAIKQMDASLVTSSEEGAITYKIGAIGMIDNRLKSDEFEVIDSNNTTKILKKSELAQLLQFNPEIEEKSKVLASDSHKKKIIKLSQRTEDTIKKEVSSSFNEMSQKIQSLPDDENTMEKLQIDWKPLLDALGYSKFFTKPIEEKEKKIIKTERPSLRKKNRIKEKLMAALRSSLLPLITSGEIVEPGGDYFKLFKKLEAQNGAWMDAAIKEVLVDPGRISQFNQSARKEESGLEENQLAYLQLSSNWIIKYIESTVDGELQKRDLDNAITKIKNITLEKEKEIKNYYLSKDFNMGNFKGLQLKPNLRLPLFQKVKLAVSEADRIAESPLKNILKGLGQIAVGILSTIPDRGDAAVAKANADQNRAIFNGLFSIFKAGAYAINKQAGRDFEKGVEKTTAKLRLDTIGADLYKKGEGPKFFKSAEKSANESEASPGTSFQTPESLPDNTMDTMSLAGPQKKKKSEKKIITKVSNFSDFLKKD